MRMSRRERGMTLVEVVVTVAIMSIVMVIIYSFFVAQSRAMKNQEGTVEMTENGRYAMDFLTREIRTAGFLVDRIYAVMLENDCGRVGNNLGWNGTQFNIGGATAMVDGDNLGTNEIDGCPNGSDRITVVSVPTDQRLSTCTPNGDCVDNQSGASPLVYIPCEGATPGTPTPTIPGACQTTLDKMGFGFVCVGNGVVPVSPVELITGCDVDDPTACLTLGIDSFQCDATQSKMQVIKFHMLDPSTMGNCTGACWTPIGGQANKNKLGLLAFIYRTFQLLDLDHDGTTELVYSDNFYNLLQHAANPQNAVWTPVAFNIDDLQFAFVQRNTPAPNDPVSYDNSSSIYQFANCPPGGGTLGGKPFVCLNEIASATTDDPPVAIRISLITRTKKKEWAGTTQTTEITGLYRLNLEDNAVPQQPFNSALMSAPPAGPAYCFSGQTCGCGDNLDAVPDNDPDYFTCVGNGNAQGYRRRTLVQTVGLRNMVGIPLAGG